MRPVKAFVRIYSRLLCRLCQVRSRLALVTLSSATGDPGLTVASLGGRLYVRALAARLGESLVGTRVLVPTYTNFTSILIAEACQ